ncbi:alpha-xenorhabdolysin family binary toxin subunit A [Pseudomonas sp. NPDC087346]|uniref:alpha-xenorhabdolysin family binary toxin subunit A n=1 Tax=Pseudomonas sp. NPDC087346 TaxID=3364438 RepID=UPI0038305D3B
MADFIGYGPLHSKITSDDIKKVKAYVQEGRGLPRTTAQVNARFKCAEFTEAREGVTTQLIEYTFNMIYANASKWGGIETNMLEVASRLSAFSDDLDLYAGAAVNSIKEMSGYDDYTLKVKDLTEVQRDTFIMRVEGENVTQSYKELDEYVKSIVRSIEEKRKKASEVKHALELFGEELQGIEKDLGVRVNGVIKANSSTRLREISEALIKVNDRIHELRKKITFTWWEWTLCGIFTGVGLAVGTAIKLARDAEVNADIEKARAEERELLKEQEKINKIMGDLKELHSNLYSMLVYTKGAIEGVTQIETLWSATLKEINESKNTLVQPREWKFLNSFVIKMESVLERWVKIKANVDALKAAVMD